MFIKKIFFKIVCDDCGKSAGPLRETVEGALEDAISEDFQPNGIGQDAVWRCPDCAMSSLDFGYAIEYRADDDLPF